MSVTGDTRFAEALANELTQVRVEVRGLLGRAALRLEKLLELDVGDLIPLDADEQAPLPIYVQGRRKLSGSPCVSGGSLALRIEADVGSIHRAEMPETLVH